MNSCVYVVQETERNILPAQQFGKLHVILSYNDVEKGSRHMITKLDKAFENMKPYDYILCIGDPLAIGLAIHCALEQTGLINVLRWDKKRYTYYNELIELENYEQRHT